MTRKEQKRPEMTDRLKSLLDHKAYQWWCLHIGNQRYCKRSFFAGAKLMLELLDSGEYSLDDIDIDKVTTY